MSLVKKSDVKNHLSPHHQKSIHLNRPLSEPDATGSNVEEQRQQPSSSGLEAPPPAGSPDSSNTAAPTVSKSAQA